MITINLFVRSVYTLTGIKKAYSLGDMAYGQWLIYKDSKPIYYLYVFDDKYSDFRDRVKTDNTQFMEQKFKALKNGLTLSPGIFGIRSSKEYREWIDLEELPADLLL